METALKKGENKMKERIYVMEFLFSDKKKVYNLMVFGEDDNYALMQNKRLLFFQCFQEAIHYYTVNKLSKNFDLEKEIALSCKLPVVLNIVKEKEIDKNASVLNCINIFDDLLKTLKLEFPVRYKKSLYKMADYLTFRKDVTEFFNSTGYKRDFIIKGILKIEQIIVKNTIIIKSEL